MTASHAEQSGANGLEPEVFGGRGMTMRNAKAVLPRHELLTSLPAAHGVVRGHVVVAVELLQDRLAEPWTLNSLAEQVHLSRSQLVRAFDATLGTSPMAHLRRMRVQRMGRLLSSTDRSMAQIARAVGWSDANYASRCFHGFYGTSPTEFRRQPLSGPTRGDLKMAGLDLASAGV